MKRMPGFLVTLFVVMLATGYAQDTVPVAQYLDKPYFWTPLSDPAFKIAEEKGVCFVSGQTAPLKLKIVPGLANPKLVSLESVESPGYFLRHQSSAIKLHPYPESDQLFAVDATFRLVVNQDGSLSFMSYNYPNQFISVTHSKKLFITPDPAPAAKSFKPVP